MKKISCVIPCYRSVKTIGKVVDEILQTVSESGYDYEIILVNDCSPDNTFEVLTQLGNRNPKIKVISLAKNFGQQSALMAGYHIATGEIIVSLDDDGQTPANEMMKLIEKIEAGYDVVFAKYQEKRHSLFRNFGSSVNNLMARYLIGKPKDLYVASYFAAKRFVIQELLKYDKSYPYLLGLILRTTRNFTNVPVNHRDREAGESGYRFTQLLSLWMNGFTAFSVKPLRIATFIGVVCALVGFLFGGYTVIHKITNPQTPAGYSSLMSIMLFLGGMIMLILGLIGEYIGRIYISINNSPQFVIRDTINIEVDEEK